MDDPQSSNPLEAALDAGSKVLGDAIGALIDPFGSDTNSDDDNDRSEEQDSAEQEAADSREACADEDHSDDDNDDYDYYDDDDLGGQSAGVAAAPYLSQSPARSYQRSTFNTFSSKSSTRFETSNASVGEVFSRVGKAVLLGLFLYPVIGLGGCITRIVIQGTPPHPMYQQQAHDQWLHSPVQSWTTEAVIIPLAIIAITFFGGLIKTRSNPIITVVLFIVGGLATIFIGIKLTNSLRKDSPGTPTINASSQTTGTMREVNATKLNMRSGPGSNHPVVTTFTRKMKIVSYGEPMKVNGELWIQASTPDGQLRGWVNSKFLSP